MRTTPRHPDWRASRRWLIGPLLVTYDRRGRDAHMGRFGGGWQWALGFEASKNSVVLNLLVAIVRVSRRRGR